MLSSAGAAPETASLTVVNTIADFERVIDRNMQHKETADLYRTVRFKWGLKNVTVQLQQSLNEGATWTTTNAVANLKNATAEITGLLTDRFYRFRLMVTEGINKGVSNTISFYSLLYSIFSLLSSKLNKMMAAAFPISKAGCRIVVSDG